MRRRTQFDAWHHKSIQKEKNIKTKNKRMPLREKNEEEVRGHNW